MLLFRRVTGGERKENFTNIDFIKYVAHKFLNLKIF